MKWILLVLVLAIAQDGGCGCATPPVKSSPEVFPVAWGDDSRSEGIWVCAETRDGKGLHCISFRDTLQELLAPYDLVPRKRRPLDTYTPGGDPL